MAFDKNIILSHIPEFYLEEKVLEDVIINDNSEYENIELVYPNTVNLSANIMDKLNEELPKFNTWGNIDDYIQEFRLPEIFYGSDLYSIKQTELLKGFFLFKGTNIDIQYVMKIAGYNLEIFEDGECQLSSVVYVDLDREDFTGFRSSETVKKIRDILEHRISVCSYLQSISLHLLTRSFYPLSKHLRNNTSFEIEKNFEDRMKKTELKVRNIKPIKVDNQAGIKVEGMPRDTVIDLFFFEMEKHFFDDFDKVEESYNSQIDKYFTDKYLVKNFESVIEQELDKTFEDRLKKEIIKIVNVNPIKVDNLAGIKVTGNFDFIYEKISVVFDREMKDEYNAIESFLGVETTKYWNDNFIVSKTKDILRSEIDKNLNDKVKQGSEPTLSSNSSSLINKEFKDTYNKNDETLSIDVDYYISYYHGLKIGGNDVIDVGKDVKFQAKVNNQGEPNMAYKTL